MQEGIVIGGGSTLLKLSAKVDAIKETLDNDEQRVGADIIKRSAHPLRPSLPPTHPYRMPHAPCP